MTDGIGKSSCDSRCQTGLCRAALRSPGATKHFIREKNGAGTQPAEAKALPDAAITKTVMSGDHLQYEIDRLSSNRSAFHVELNIIRSEVSAMKIDLTIVSG